jgi:hypothetical protein
MMLTHLSYSFTQAALELAGGGGMAPPFSVWHSVREAREAFHGLGGPGCCIV